MKIFTKKNKQLIFLATKIVTLILLLFMFLHEESAAQIQTSQLDEVINRLQETYEKTRDFKASFIQQTTIRSIKKTDIESGVVFFKNPKNMLWNYSQPKAKKLVINPRKAWLYLPQEKVAYQQEADYIFKSKVLIKFLSGLGKLKDDFAIRFADSGALDKNNNYLLVLKPLEKSAALNPFLITVDRNTFLILQVSFEDTMGNSTLLKFSNITVNIGLADKLFQFQPPEGVGIFNMP